MLSIDARFCRHQYRALKEQQQQQQNLSDGIHPWRVMLRLVLSFSCSLPEIRMGAGTGSAATGATADLEYSNSRLSILSIH